MAKKKNIGLVSDSGTPGPGLVAAKMKVHYSSNTNEWATPDYIYLPLNAEFKFTLDPCCTRETAKCKTFITAEQDGLSQSWGNHTVFCNPPYGRAIGKWIKKCHEEAQKGCGRVVMLIPARTDTKAWYQHVRHASEIRFVVGRIKFHNADQAKPAPAPFPSAIVVFTKENHRPIISWVEF